MIINRTTFEEIMELEPRPTQTRVKHEILTRYLDTWGGIIVNGLKARAMGKGRAYTGHFVYADCFSSAGRYAGECEDVVQHRELRTVEGSPVIGIRALDKLAAYARGIGIDITTNVILIEKDPAVFGVLQGTLELEGVARRVKNTTDFSSLANGEIATVNSDCTTLGNELVAYTTSGYTWSFYLLDPRGPSGIPYDFVKTIVRQDRHDVMINFIYEDLLRKTGMCLNDNLGPRQQQLIDNWTAAFGSERWIEIARETLADERDHRYWRGDVLEGIPLDDMDEGSLMTDEQLGQIKERRFVDAYRAVLQDMDSELVTKLVDLRFPDRERTMFYLFLTTHDPTGALWLNRILYDAKYLEYELRYRFNIAKKTAPPAGQIPLFEMEPTVPKQDAAPRPTIEEIADLIWGRLSGTVTKKRDVYRAVADEIFFVDEVDKAIKYLKRTDKANYNGELRHHTEIRFSR
jgi:three-Cys-motif partner protein